MNLSAVKLTSNASYDVYGNYETEVFFSMDGAVGGDQFYKLIKTDYSDEEY